MYLMIHYTNKATGEKIYQTEYNFILKENSLRELLEGFNIVPGDIDTIIKMSEHSWYDYYIPQGSISVCNDPKGELIEMFRRGNCNKQNFELVMDMAEGIGA